MKYTDMSKQNKMAARRKGRGLSKVFVFFIALAIISGIFLVFKDTVKKAFSPVSIVGGSTKIDIKETDGRTNILILGSDKRNFGNESGRNTLTDTILIASIGNTDNDVVLISLPRDLWISNYNLENGYKYSSKINEVYSNAGIQELRNQLEVVLGIPMHYHVIVTFDIFENVINILGGIDINVERSFTDYAYPIEGKEGDLCGKTQEEADKIFKEAEEKELDKETVALNTFTCRYETLKFEQGLQKMDGNTALKYARSRHGDNGESSDFSRSKRQQNVIMAVKNKGLSLETLVNFSKLKELYDQYANNVETDINLGDLQSFFQLSQKLDFEKVIQIVIDDSADGNEGGLLYHPNDSTLYGGAWVLIPQAGDYSQIHAYVQKYLFGNK